MVELAGASAGRDVGSARVAPLIERFGRIDLLIDIEPDPDAVARGESTGRPLGSPAFVTELEQRLSRKLRQQKPGRNPLPDPAGDNWNYVSCHRNS